MHKHAPQEKDVQSVEQGSIFQRGIDAGLLAQELFPGGIDASPDAPYLYAQSIEDTARYMRQGHQIIYEAAFQYDGVMCAVDMLVKDNNEWTAYEVKSSTAVKPAHLQDAALQYYVIKNSGVAIKEFALVHINKQYVRQGALDLKKLFKPQSLLADILPAQELIGEKINELLAVARQTTTPEIEPGMQCLKPYPCDFLSFCGAMEVLQKLQDAEQSGVAVNDVPEEKELKIKYPLHFLYTNTWLSAIPERDGDWPYRPVYFQLQGKTIKEKNAEPSNWNYISSNKWESDEANFSLLKEKLLLHEGSIIVVDKETESYNLSTLAKAYPKEAAAINNIKRRLVELPKRKTEETKNSAVKEINLINSSVQAAAIFYNIPKNIPEAEKEMLQTKLKEFGDEELQKMMKKLND